MIQINLLANPVLGFYVNGLRQLGAMTRLDPTHFDAGEFLDHARSLRNEMDALLEPTHRLSAAISLFDDLAGDRMLRPDTARAVMDRMRKEIRPAALVPGYNQFKPIGFGGYGVVYWALRENTDQPVSITERQVAIKVGRLTPKGASTDSIKRAYTVERLREVYRREFEFLKDIDSERIVKVYETGVTERGKPYIVMEYLGGGNLMHFTRRLHNGEIGFSWQTLYPIFEQILEAASVLHERGIIHNDIKPENYLMGRDWQVKLTDLSFVTTVAEALKHGPRNYRGTAGHMTIQTTESPYKDVHAVGSTFYQILTGRTPAKQTSELSALAALLYGVVPPSQRCPWQIPPELDRFIMRALNPRAEVRFKDAMEMLTSFRRLKPILLRQPAPRVKPQPRVRRSRNINRSSSSK